MFERLKVKIRNAKDEKARRLENERIRRAEALRAQEIMSQNYQDKQKKDRLIDEAAVSLRAAVDGGDINEIIRIVQQYGHCARVMNSRYQDTAYLSDKGPGYSNAVDTVLIRALKRGDLDMVSILMQADAINPDQKQAWHYVTIDKKHAVWRCCILPSPYIPEYDPNQVKITLLSAKQYAKNYCPQALPLISRSAANMDTSGKQQACTANDSYSDFLLWKKQRKEAQQHKFENTFKISRTH